LSDSETKEEAVKREMALLAGAAIGAGTMLLLDPDRGARRRALIRDKAARAAKRTSHGFDALTRDVANRTRGVSASIRHVLDRSTPERRKLIERVHAELGRRVSQPRAIDVSVPHEGCVCLSGPVLEDEADAALAAVVGVRGVRRVEDNLERHDSAEGIPALQGGWMRIGTGSGPSRHPWSPTTKLVFALTGTAVAAGVTYALRSAGSEAAA